MIWLEVTWSVQRPTVAYSSHDCNIDADDADDDDDEESEIFFDIWD